MRFLGNAYLPRNQQAAERVKSADYLRVRGTDRPPSPPRDIQTQPGPRVILVTWKLPTVSQDIAGWRVYKDDENTLFHEFHDRGTKQCVVEVSAGATPPTVNVFVSSVNALGVESVKVQAQGSASVEAGAPTMPGVPPGYNNENAGGGSTGTGGQRK